MGSSYFGEPNLGSERGGGGSSRKGKKTNNSEKPKQPQRGLGVAQLEKIRLHGQMATCNYQYPNYPTTNLNHQEDMGIQQTGGYSSIPSSSFSYSSSSAASSASYGFNPNVMMGMGDYDRTTNIRYGDSQPSTAASWNAAHSMFEAQNYVHPNANATRHLLPLQVEQKSKKKQRSSSMESSSQNSESSDTQDLDLELRLSI